MHRWSAKLFTILGIRVEVHVTFLILLGLFCWQGYQSSGAYGAFAGLVILMLVFTSIILHELGHCIIAMQYGVRIPRILLLPIGGVAMMNSMPRQPIAELAITLAGPLVNFVLAGILFIIVGMPASAWPQQAFSLNPLMLAQTLLLWNLVMGLFNLIPVFPMDGGRIFRALLAMRFNYLDATRVATYTAKALVLVGIGFALIYQSNYILAALFAFIWIGGEAEYRQVRINETYRGLTVGDVTIAWLGGENDPNLANRQALIVDRPLELYAKLLEVDSSRVYPVYDENGFVGVVDTARLKPAIKAARLRMKNNQLSGPPSLA